MCIYVFMLDSLTYIHTYIHIYIYIHIYYVYRDISIVDYYIYFGDKPIRMISIETQSKFFTYRTGEMNLGSTRTSSTRWKFSTADSYIYIYICDLYMWYIYIYIYDLYIYIYIYTILYVWYRDRLRLRGWVTFLLHPSTGKSGKRQGVGGYFPW